MVLKRIGINSAGKTLGCFFTPIGLIYGFLVAITLLLEPDNNLGSHISFGLLAMIISPIVFGVLGMICGLLLAACFNIAATFTGGIDFELTQIPDENVPVK